MGGRLPPQAAGREAVLAAEHAAEVFVAGKPALRGYLRNRGGRLEKQRVGAAEAQAEHVVPEGHALFAVKDTREVVFRNAAVAGDGAPVKGMGELCVDKVERLLYGQAGACREWRRCSRKQRLEPDEEPVREDH